MIKIEEVPNGKIEVDSHIGKKLGFNSKRFLSASYLWRDGKYIYVSFIAVTHPRRGYLRELFQTLEKLGLGIKVPTPFARMKEILLKQDYKQTNERFDGEIHDDCEVWVNEAKT